MGLQHTLPPAGGAQACTGARGAARAGGAARARVALAPLEQQPSRARRGERVFSWPSPLLRCAAARRSDDVDCSDALSSPHAPRSTASSRSASPWAATGGSATASIRPSRASARAPVASSGQARASSVVACQLGALRPRGHRGAHRCVLVDRVRPWRRSGVRGPRCHGSAPGLTSPAVVPRPCICVCRMASAARANEWHSSSRREQTSATYVAV